MTYDLYTDGSCLNNPGIGGIGFVILQNDNIIYKFSAAEPHSTNNIMELTAVILGISHIRNNISPDAQINVYTDSQYVEKGMNEWLAKWQKKKFKGVKNLEYWEMLIGISSNCKFIKVPAHSDNVYNNMADSLATEASRSLQKRI